MLNYYENEESTHLKGHIMLRDVTSVQHVKDLDVPDAYRTSEDGEDAPGFGFELATSTISKRHFRMVAPSELEGLQWLQAIKMGLEDESNWIRRFHGTSTLTQASRYEVEGVRQSSNSVSEWIRPSNVFAYAGVHVIMWLLANLGQAHQDKVTTNNRTAHQILGR